MQVPLFFVLGETAITGGMWLPKAATVYILPEQKHSLQG